MIEKTIYEYLNSKGIKAFLQVPEKPPKSYVLLDKTGGEKTNHVNVSTIALQSFSDTLFNTSTLNEQVKEAMEDIVELPEISGARLTNDYNFTDATTKKYRYQAVYRIYY